MALVVKDRVRESSSSTGTGTFVLSGAVSGFQSFSVIGDGNTTYYAIVDSTNGAWEVGIGTYTSSGTTLSRDTILESSNSGNAVDFAAGVKDVFCTYPAERSVDTELTQTLNNKTLASPTITGNATINAQGDLRFADADSSNYVAFQAPATITTNVLWTLPAADGSANQVLKTDGSGNLGWVTPNAGTVTSVDVSGGTTGLTTSGGPVTGSGTITLAGTLNVANGGTGATTLTGVVKGNGTSAFTAGNVNLASEVTGTLPVANGGTGQTSYTDGQLLIGNTATGSLSKSTLTAGSNVTITNGNGTITIASTNPGGDVVGPASATDNAIARFDGTTGKLIQNSAVTIADDGATVISVDSATDALRITQIGAGNALLVEDSANPDSSPVVVTNAGRFVIGYTTNIAGSGGVNSFYQQHGISNAGASAGFYDWQNVAIAGPIYNFNKSKSGAIGTRGIVSSGDRLGTITFAGDDGTNFISAGQISCLVDGTPGTNDMPGRLTFSTTADGASTPIERLRIDSTGLARFQVDSTQDAVAICGRAGGTSSYAATITPTTLSSSRTVTLPDADINFATGLGVAQGGTGTTALTANNVILGNGTSAVQFVAPGTNGNVLTSNGTTWVSSAGVSLASPLAVTGNSTSGAEIRLPEDTDNGINYVALKAADSIASNVTFTLPSADGTNGQVLQTNGSGVLSFVTPTSGGITTGKSIAMAMIFGF
jgi:hypothetical protein